MYMPRVVLKYILPAFLLAVLSCLSVHAQGREQMLKLMENNQLQVTVPVTGNPSIIKVARLHYSGGGDWYWGSSAIPNFLRFISQNSPFPVDTMEHEVKIMDPDLFKYPFLFATGHGIISFNSEEQERLRQYLANGGFLFVNDSYGMKETFPKELAKLFPDRQIVELPYDHPIYHCFYDFPNGPPKIHEHDNLPPRAYSIIVNGRAVVYFLIESDIGDGWEDPQVHHDPEQKRQDALRMGLNLLTYALLY